MIMQGIKAMEAKKQAEAETSARLTSLEQSVSAISAEKQSLASELANKQNILIQKDIEIASIKTNYEQQIQSLKIELSQVKSQNALLQSKLNENSQIIGSLTKSTEDLQVDKKDLRNDKVLLQEQNKELQKTVDNLKAEIEIDLQTSKLSLSDIPVVESSPNNILGDTIESVALSGVDSYSIIDTEDANN